MAQIKSQSLWSQGGAASRITCQQRTTGWVSIPLKSGRCCKTIFIKLLLGWVSQSLWSQGGAASCTSPNHWRGWLSQSLWSQGGAASENFDTVENHISLNPFEVREVLQVLVRATTRGDGVSIPLKSGRCCKYLPLVASITAVVSIPLKSGRCCKVKAMPFWSASSSQSLWSQGGAARLLHGECGATRMSQSLWSQGGAASGYYICIRST